MATDRCKEQIKKAIELDQIVLVNDEVQFSSSAVDGTGFLFLLMKLDEEVHMYSVVHSLLGFYIVFRKTADPTLLLCYSVSIAIGLRLSYGQVGRQNTNTVKHINTCPPKND